MAAIIINAIHRARSVRSLALACGLITLSGCALSGREAFEDVTATIEERTGQRIEWHADEEARQAALKRVESLLAAPLTADSAVQIALLNNRRLQAKYEEFGMARAEVVHASLLSNPVLEGSYQDSVNGGEGPVIELALLQNIIDLLTLPQRREIAQQQLMATQAHVAREILSLSAEVRAQFYAVQSDEQMLDLMQHVVDSTAAGLEMAQRQHAAGNITDLDLARQRSSHSRAKLNLAGVELESLKERERLYILMGLWGDQVEANIEPRLPDPPETPLDLDAMERRAIEANFALTALRHEIAAEGGALGLTRATALMPDLELGGAFSREDDGNRLLGPVVSLPLPLFDQGQSEIRKSHARLNQLLHEYYQKAVEVRATARTARDHLRLARERVEYTRLEEVPLARDIFRHTQLEFNAMQTGIFELLQAREFEIDTGKRYVEDLRDYWTARTEVEAVLQGHITEFGMQTTPLDEVPGSPLH